MSARVRDLMRRDFIRVSPDEALLDVLQLMTMARVRALPVMQGERPSGLVAHRDLALAALGLADDPAAPSTPVAAFVRPVAAVSPEASASEAARRMLGSHVPCLVATEPEGDEERVVGLVTEGDLLRDAYRPTASRAGS